MIVIIIVFCNLLQKGNNFTFLANIKNGIFYEHQIYMELVECVLSLSSYL